MMDPNIVAGTMGGTRLPEGVHPDEVHENPPLEPPEGVINTGATPPSSAEIGGTGVRGNKPPEGYEDVNDQDGHETV